MRIISGRFRGKQLAAPTGTTTRPTADRARQGLFNILEHAAWLPSFNDLRVLDLFAGSGALGLEAVSRGAKSCVFVDNHRDALKALRGNILACPLDPTTALVLQRDACALPTPPKDLAPVDLVFADPPYRTGLAIQALAALRDEWLTPGAIAVVEEASHTDLDAIPGWIMIEHRAYGAAAFHILQRQG